MKKSVFVLALTVCFGLFCCSHIHASDKIPKLEGEIGKYKVVMQLFFDYEKETVSGWYYYKSKGAKNKIKLSGKFKGSTPFDGITMTESVNGKITGKFDCEYMWGTGDLGLGGHTPFITLSGLFTNAVGKEFDFEVSNF